MSVVSDFSEVYGSIFDIIQNSGLAAILGVNTLGAIKPVRFLFSLKKVTEGPYLFCDPHDNTVLAYI